jgi:hypothetical protein
MFAGILLDGASQSPESSLVYRPDHVRTRQPSADKIGFEQSPSPRKLPDGA